MIQRWRSYATFVYSLCTGRSSYFIANFCWRNLKMVYLNQTASSRRKWWNTSRCVGKEFILTGYIFKGQEQLLVNWLVVECEHPHQDQYFCNQEQDGAKSAGKCRKSVERCWSLKIFNATECCGWFTVEKILNKKKQSWRLISKISKQKRLDRGKLILREFDRASSKTFDWSDQKMFNAEFATNKQN